MYSPSLWLMILVSILAGVSWILYAKSQHGRWQSKVLGWLSLPFFALGGMYLLLILLDHPFELFAAQTRLAMISIPFSQFIILALVAHYNQRRK
jgi:hypothetical protein